MFCPMFWHQTLINARSDIQNLFVVNNYCQNLIVAMDLSSEQKCFLYLYYLLRMELFFQGWKIIPSAVNKYTLLLTLQNHCHDQILTIIIDCKQILNIVM